MTNRTLQQRRNRLVTRSATAFVLIALASGFGIFPAWTAWVVPKPDWAKLSLIELARQHYSATGTTTILKENDRAFAIFDQQYNFRNRHNRIAEERLSRSPLNDLELFFTYLPDSKGVAAVTLTEIRETGIPPSLTFSTPSRHPETSAQGV